MYIHWPLTTTITLQAQHTTMLCKPSYCVVVVIIIILLPIGRLLLLLLPIAFPIIIPITIPIEISIRIFVEILVQIVHLKIGVGRRKQQNKTKQTTEKQNWTKKCRVPDLFPCRKLTIRKHTNQGWYVKPGETQDEDWFKTGIPPTGRENHANIYVSCDTWCNAKKCPLDN